MVMHGGGREEYRYRSLLGVYPPVAQDEDGNPSPDGLLRALTQLLQGPLHPLFALLGGEESRERGGLERWAVQLPQLLDILLLQDGLLEYHPPTVLGSLIEEVALRA